MAKDDDAIFAELHKRLYESGEWERVMAVLMDRLNEKGWIGEIRSKSKERARAMEKLNFETLIKEIEPQAKASVPEDVTKEIMALLMKFLKDQVD